MPLDDELPLHLLITFKSELEEHLALINRDLIELERTGMQEEVLHEVFRSVHNLKGAASAIGLAMIQKIAHSLEHLFGAARRREYIFSPAAFDLCYEGLDTMSELLEAELRELELPALVDVEFEQRVYQLLESTPGEPVDADSESPCITENLSLQAPSPVEMMAASHLGVKDDSPLPTTISGEALASSQSDSIRIPIVKIDRLMSDIGELLISKNRYEQRLNELEQIGAEVELALKDWSRLRPLRRKLSKSVEGKAVQRLLDSLDTHQLRLRNINRLSQLLTKNSANDELHLGLSVAALQQEIQGLRMLPLRTLFDPLRRQARDLARKHDKKVAVEFSGEETELDRQLLEAIRDPLVHLIRNSIDHGLEPPETRQQLGKNPEGTIKLMAEQRGNQIVIEIADDGGGINLDGVKDRARALGLFTEPELKTFTQAELLSLIFRPGFSTRTKATETSGRGMGLDIVKVNIERVRGQIEVTTKEDAGALFRITLPLTLSTLHVLLVKSGSQIVALPVSSIDRAVRINPKDTYTVESRMAISFDSRSISLIALDALLGLEESRQAETANWTVLIVSHSGERAAFIVTEILGEQEMVIQSLGKQLKKVNNIAGGGVLGDGSVILLLNPADLLRTVHGSKNQIAITPPKQEERRSSKRKILVVDDSITTRTLEKNILEIAGYEVILAKDGAEGLALAHTSGCDLVISDIEMPQLNGFELTKRIKSDARLKRLPVILVSSRDSQQDKVQGAEAGADVYMVKSQFEQAHFLELVESMIAA
ncbi:MAG: hybrid sensor histidine kinase/response regulator [Acidobacteria bacterium]|nr:hybrid sensor histidine kinase/response regulator [Acidobacteriota bacterium]